MAVVSISRIQIRRGTALQGTGLPQLASGELGWAIDTQELYIGNGSTAEGAPAVGNTQILTENTNIFELAEQYTYRSTDDSNIQTSETIPVARSISERLDDRVSIKSFGGIDTAQQLQKAVYELYLKGNTIDATGTSINSADAPILHIEPGEFVITQTIYVPPFTTIVGAGKDKTILRKTGDFDMFRTISSNSKYTGKLSTSFEEFIPSSIGNQARSIRFENMTLEAGEIAASGNSYLLYLDNCRDSEFKNIRFSFYSETDNTLVSIREIAVGFASKSDTVCANSNKFIDCDFIGLESAAYSPHTVKNNSFVRCKFDRLRRGVVLGDNLPFDQLTGGQDNTITNSRFSNIYQHAFLVPAGTGNRSQDNTYAANVGNNNSNVAMYPIVSFSDSDNFSIDDTFERTYNLAIATGNTTYYPEVKGPVTYTMRNSENTDISSGEQPVFRLPADSTKFYTVEYFYNSTFGSYKRMGTLSVMVYIDPTDVTNSTADLVDEYDFTGDDGAGGKSVKFKSAIRYLAGANPAEILAVQISTISNGTNNGAGVGGELVFKITSKS